MFRSGSLLLQTTATSAFKSGRSMCEPPTHRSVLKGSSPPPHHPRECPLEPPLSAPAGGGSRLHRPSGASLASDDRGGQSVSAAHLSSGICEVTRKPPALTRGCSQRSNGSRRPPQRRKRYSPPPPIEAMPWRFMLPKAERCAGGNILAMRCRFAPEEVPHLGQAPADAGLLLDD